MFASQCSVYQHNVDQSNKLTVKKIAIRTRMYREQAKKKVEQKHFSLRPGISVNYDSLMKGSVRFMARRWVVFREGSPRPGAAAHRLTWANLRPTSPPAHQLYRSVANQACNSLSSQAHRSFGPPALQPCSSLAHQPFSYSPFQPTSPLALHPTSCAARHPSTLQPTNPAVL